MTDTEHDYSGISELIEVMTLKFDAEKKAIEVQEN